MKEKLLTIGDVWTAEALEDLGPTLRSAMTPWSVPAVVADLPRLGRADMCKQCGKAYVVKREEQEFCNSQCRNKAWHLSEKENKLLKDRKFKLSSLF